MIVNVPDHVRLNFISFYDNWKAERLRLLLYSVMEAVAMVRVTVVRMSSELEIVVVTLVMVLITIKAAVMGNSDSGGGDRTSDVI